MKAARTGASAREEKRRSRGRSGRSALGLALEPSCYAGLVELPIEIRDEACSLFHDARLVDVDPVRHAEWIIGRVLERGTMRSVRSLAGFYGEGRLRAFFASEAAARVSPQTRALWRSYFGLEDVACTPRSSLRLSSPFFPG